MNNEMEILYGGADLTVSIVVDKELKRETVKVRKVSLREMPLLGQVMARNDDLAEAAFYVAKDEAWAADVDPADTLTILEEGRRLNAQVFQKWFGVVKQRFDILGIDPAQLANQKDVKSDSPSSSNS